jgi:hypothetical protein
VETLPPETPRERRLSKEERDREAANHLLAELGEAFA